MTPILRVGGEGKTKMRCCQRYRAAAVSECSGRPIFDFFIKGNWIRVMTRHHAVPNINILLSRNLPFDSDGQTVKPSFNYTIALFAG